MRVKGVIIGSVSNTHRNVIGTHSGSYSVYRAISAAAGRLEPGHVPDLTDTVLPHQLALTINGLTQQKSYHSIHGDT